MTIIVIIIIDNYYKNYEKKKVFQYLSNGQKILIKQKAYKIN
jgi:hypothetical protein